MVQALSTAVEVQELGKGHGGRVGEVDAGRDESDVALEEVDGFVAGDAQG